MHHFPVLPVPRARPSAQWLLLGALLAGSDGGRAADKGPSDDEGKGVFSVTRPAFGLVDGVVFAGTGTGRLDGTGSLAVFAQAEPAAAGRPAAPAIACRGRFEHNFRTGKGRLSCDNGEVADFSFRFTGLTEGVGEGQSQAHGPVRFTFGLDAEQAARELGLPAGTRIRLAKSDAGPPIYRLEKATPKVDEPPPGERAAPLPSPASKSPASAPAPAPAPPSTPAPTSSPAPTPSP